MSERKGDAALFLGIGTQLLVSVRDSREARLAAEAGVDLIDVKEPSAGPLGAAAPETLSEIVAAVGGARPLSVALGELDDFDFQRSLPGGIGFAKLGLSACAGRCDWPARWRQALAALPLDVVKVAVVYADHRAARSPEARPILTQAKRLGCRAMLVDTFDKQSGGLLHHWPLEQVARFIDTAHTAGLWAGVAGGLSAEAIGQLLPLRPDYVAVRGAACDGGRSGAISAERLAELVSLVRSAPARSEA